MEADTIPPVAENTSLFGLFFKWFFFIFVMDELSRAVEREMTDEIYNE